MSLTRKRDSLRKKLIDFVEQNQGRKKILLVKAPAGIGKTFIACLALFAREDILTVWLAPRHKQAKKDVVDVVKKEIDKNILHLKGRNQEGMCLNPEALKRIPDKCNISEKIICERSCDHFTSHTCPYYILQNKIRNEIQSWVGVHHHLQTDIVSNYFHHIAPFKCLVLDEYFINNIMKDVKIYRSDLEKLEDALTEISHEKVHTAHEIDIFMDIILALKRILAMTTSRKGITGLEFVNIFTDSIKKVMAYNKGKNREFDFENLLNQKSIKHFIKNEFYPELIRRINNGETIKNALNELLLIAQQCLDISKNPPKHDINLPFFSGMKISEYKKTLKKYIQFSRVFDDLPDVPIIILDATGDAKFYGDLFNCEIEEYKPSIPIDRNIIQITDGYYWKKTLQHPESRNRLFNIIYEIVKHHLEKGENIVNIITYKTYTTKIGEFLRKKKIEVGQIRFANFGATRGTNDMKNDKTLIIVGTYEPNIMDFPKKVGVWYIGKKPISNERIGRHEYKDPRYQAHVKMAREHEAEQNVDRLRQINSDPDKTVYLLTKLPIAYETRKIRGDKLMEEFESDERKETIKKITNLRYNPICVYLKHVRDRDRDTFRTLHNRLLRNKPFMKDRNLLSRTKDSIVKLGLIENDGDGVEITEKGTEKLISMENELERLKTMIYGDY